MAAHFLLELDTTEREAPGVLELTLDTTAPQAVLATPSIAGNDLRVNFEVSEPSVYRTTLSYGQNEIEGVVYSDHVSFTIPSNLQYGTVRLWTRDQVLNEGVFSATFGNAPVEPPLTIEIAVVPEGDRRPQVYRRFSRPNDGPSA